MSHGVRAALAVLAATCMGFTVETSVTHGCHERWAVEALASEGYASPPPALEGQDRLLFESLDFDVSFVDRNIHALSLVVGVRLPDVGARSGVDIARLVSLHNDPADQPVHFLRSAWDDGEAGDAAAIEACRDLLVREMALVFDAVDADGDPDPSIREPVAVNLMYQGRTEVPLSSLFVHLGIAMHVIQDSFSHTYRTVDRRGIVEVMNWIDDVAGNLDAVRDGPPHTAASDDCRCGRPGGQATYDAALEASRELLVLATRPAPRAEREAALGELLDRWVSHVPGCTRENDYCASPDPVDLAGDPCSGCSCTLPGGTDGGAAWVLVALFAAAALRRR